jgi:glycosyltransferase involved in cell wall biosynthesis
MPKSRKLRFTVAITVWQRPELLPRVLHNLLRQTYDDWDCLIVCDGPHPRAYGLVAGLIARSAVLCSRTNFHELGRREGLWGNHLRRWALEHAHGDYCCIIGHDCMIDRDYLEKHAENIDRAAVPCLSLVDVHVWTNRVLGAPETQYATPRYLGVWPPSGADISALKVAQVDLTGIAWPLPEAIDHGAFAEDMWSTYAADFLSYTRLLLHLPVVHVTGPCAVHF